MVLSESLMDKINSIEEQQISVSREIEILRMNKSKQTKMLEIKNRIEECL